MPSGSSVFEEQRVGMPQIEQHYGIGYAYHRNVGPGLGDDRRRVGDHLLVRFVGSEDRVSRLFLPHRVLGLLVAVLEAALVAPELLFDTLGRLLERLMSVLRLSMALENQALVDVQHDVAGESSAIGRAS